ncbi:MAG: hypothetical protein Q7J15_07370 [Candidatus Desulfaltia sp.]|nr:hypothetical protein [Candidatus Desulfaltia sp.]
MAETLGSEAKEVIRVFLKEAIVEFSEYLLVELNRSKETEKGYKRDLNTGLEFSCNT